jgi:hypothetical protein
MVWNDATQSCQNKEVPSRRLTSEERLDIVINHYLCNQISMDNEEIIRAEAKGMKEASIDDLKKRFTPIPYNNKSEFLQENPDCCKPFPYPSHQDMFGYDLFPLWGDEPEYGSERASGMGEGIFAFKRKVRYMDREGGLKEIKTTETYTVSNCGYLRVFGVSETLLADEIREFGEN